MTAACDHNVRFLTLTGILICALLSATAAAQKGQFTLPPGCTLPFDNIATKPDPFQQCGNCGAVSQKEGTGANEKAKALQSQAKNNFCADTSAVTVIDFASLRTMGATAEQNGWEIIDLPNRQPLHNFFPVNGKSIGEGDVARLKA